MCLPLEWFSFRYGLLALLVNLAIRSIVLRVSLGSFDRLIGGFFGVVRGVLLVAVILMFINVSPFRNASVITHSRLVPSFHRVVVEMDGYVPKQMQRVTHWAMGGK